MLLTLNKDFMTKNAIDSIGLTISVMFVLFVFLDFHKSHSDNEIIIITSSMFVVRFLYNFINKDRVKQRSYKDLIFSALFISIAFILCF